MAELFDTTRNNITMHIKNIFEEVLEKIRDIRSSEKVFWRKILDIYATSVDYDARDEKTKEFFRTVQNKILKEILLQKQKQKLLKIMGEDIKKLK